METVLALEIKYKAQNDDNQNDRFQTCFATANQARGHNLFSRYVASLEFYHKKSYQATFVNLLETCPDTSVSLENNYCQFIGAVVSMDIGRFLKENGKNIFMLEQSEQEAVSKFP